MLLKLSFGGVVILIFILFLPRSYDVESFQKRKGTQYWELGTGSKIAYYKIPRSQESAQNPIIYLHGGPGGMVSNDVISTLKPFSKQGHDLYFYDQVGSGHSNRLSDISEYTVERHKKDLKEIISRITIDKVILIGHSWGSLLAVNYLEDYSQTVEKLILTGPGPILPINKKLIKEVAPDSLALVEPEFSNREGNRKAYNWRSKLILKWAYLFNEKLASDKEADNFFTFLNQELSKSTTCYPDNSKKYPGGAGYYSHIMTVRSFRKVKDRRNELQSIKTPILLLRGQCDNQKWGFTKEYLDLFSNSRLKIIEDAGHDIISADSEAYYTLINQFINEN